MSGTILELAEILRILPHRPPFLFVDRVTELVAGERIVGERTVRADEPWFPGHFPGAPVFPGVLLLEAMVQIGGILAHAGDEADATKPSGEPRLLSADKVKFRRAVIPGDVLELTAVVVQRREGALRFRGEVRVSGQLVAEAELLAGRVQAAAP